MRIEPYSEKYFHDVFKLIENFHNEAVGEYDAQFNTESVTNTIRSADPDDVFLLIVDDKCQGLLYGERYKSRLNETHIFQEVIWYVNEPYRGQGIRFFREVENKLKSKGVNVIIMVVLENSKTEKLKSFYSRIGYRPMETHFVRSLNGLG